MSTSLKNEVSFPAEEISVPKMENKNIKASFNAKTGEISDIYYKQGVLRRKNIPLTHNFYEYDSDVKEDHRLFLPNGDPNLLIPSSGILF